MVLGGVFLTIPGFLLSMSGYNKVAEVCFFVRGSRPQFPTKQTMVTVERLGAPRWSLFFIFFVTRRTPPHPLHCFHALCSDHKDAQCGRHSGVRFFSFHSTSMLTFSPRNFPNAFFMQVVPQEKNPLNCLRHSK